MIAPLFTYWPDVLQTISILFGLYVGVRSIKENTGTLRLRNVIELNRSYQNIWHQAVTDPNLIRVFDSGVHLAEEPVTLQEEFMVKFAINHLYTTYVAIQVGQLPKPDGMDENVRDFFNLPIPREVWERKKGYQDKGFVEYVDSTRD